ncbi:unnamed protein product [Nezara viridula]|uniref:Cystatin domain-containing protein n=1 Tax=Nezara viridula TaxID=85310 RepID=A0A9P0DY09_NEZVI|nr:unnamed protein product [Nezara viridula]
MGPLIIVVLFLGISTYAKVCPGCREVSPNSPVIHEYLANTLQSLSTSPRGLIIQEQIEVKRILKAAFQCLMGGHKKKDPEDQEIKDLLSKAVSIHNSKSNDENILVIKIVEATSQVVAGLKYKLIFIGEGDTSKKQYNCVAEVLSQPWISPEPQLLSLNLSPL